MPLPEAVDAWSAVLSAAEGKHVLVTGPQRSGTTFTARAIAHSTGHAYLDEDAVRVRDRRLLMQALSQHNPTVIQGPGFTHLLHELEGDLIVVWVKRPLSEIRKSQKRIRWGGASVEMRQYQSLPAPAHSVDCCELKVWVWEHHQQERMQVEWHELEYHSEALRKHPLYVHNRSKFSARQWR